jgi:hypothetical protein
MEQKYHPILDRPWEYSISELSWGMSDAGEYCLDLSFTKGKVERKLRFLNPQQVKIELWGSYPQSCGEMVILDIRDRGWEGLGVEVAKGGASGSPVTLYAREVLEIR